MQKDPCPPGQSSSEPQTEESPTDSHRVLPVRILVVEDYEPFRRYVCSTLATKRELQVVCEVSDGLEAIRKAEELQPDLIVIDIGLPIMNGIKAARRIRQVAPESKILFLSQETSSEVVQEALDLGARGYVAKVNAENELLDAVDAVCQGKRFVGPKISGGSLSTTPGRSQEEATPPQAPHKENFPHDHEVEFYSHELAFLENSALFVSAALSAGDTVIVFATEDHREGILQRLPAQGIDVGALLKEERYIALDAAESLAAFMDGEGYSRESFHSTIGSLLRRAQADARGRHKRVAVFGEMVAILCAQGKINAAIDLERFWNELAQKDSLQLRCAYPLTEELTGAPYALICAEHSAVVSSTDLILFA